MRPVAQGRSLRRRGLRPRLLLGGPSTRAQQARLQLCSKLCEGLAAVHGQAVGAGCSAMECEGVAKESEGADGWLREGAGLFYSCALVSCYFLIISVAVSLCHCHLFISSQPLRSLGARERSMMRQKPDRSPKVNPHI